MDQFLVRIVVLFSYARQLLPMLVNNIKHEQLFVGHS